MDTAEITGYFDPHNAAELFKAPVGTETDGLSHSFEVKVPLPGAKKVDTPKDAFPPTVAEMRQTEWPYEWPFALREKHTIHDATRRLLNTLVPVVWLLREYSCLIHYVTHEAAQDAQEYPRKSGEYDPLNSAFFGNINQRHELQAYLGDLRKYEVATRTLADDVPTDVRALALQIPTWINDVDGAVHSAADAYDDVFGYEHAIEREDATLTYVDERDETIDRLYDAFEHYDAALTSIDLQRVVWGLADSIDQEDRGTGYV